MSDIVESVRNAQKSSTQGSEEILTEVSTQYRPQQTQAVIRQKRQSGNEKLEISAPDSGKEGIIADEASPQEILDALRSQPNTTNLIRLLNYIHSASQLNRDFNIHSPGVVQAQIINVLVGTILPTFWPVLGPSDARLLLACLRSVAGLQALIARARLLLESIKQPPAPATLEELRTILTATTISIEGEGTALILWNNLTKAVVADVKRELAWKELVNAIASGRIVSVAAQAEDVIQSTSEKSLVSGWLSKGPEYATWLGQNVTSMLSRQEETDFNRSKQVKAAAQILTKALSLGYPLPLVNGLMSSFLNSILDAHANPDALKELLTHLAASPRRQFLEQALRWLSSVSRSNGTGKEQASQQDQEVSSIAAILCNIATGQSSTITFLVSILTDPTLLSSLSYSVRRAVVVLVSKLAPDQIDTSLENAISQFGSHLFIEHAPLIQQESLAQVILILAGYVHRENPMAVVMSARSSGHMQGVSNRLSSSNQRSRWLGMVVGTAISRLVDKAGSRMDFGTDEMKSTETAWYLQLITVHDTIGTLSQFRDHLRARSVVAHRPRQPKRPAEVQEMPVIDGKRMFGPLRPPAAAQTDVIGPRVTELAGDEDEGNHNENLQFQPYAKPDSDPEDSDEDATLVNRDRPKAPVYIRDVMRMLREDKDYNRFHLGIKHAASLIRRKTGFGNEVRDHAEELAAMLCNLQDPFDTPDFDELRLQALIAILLADVTALAPWLSRQAFSGDYSLSQRCIILSALGLGGRELAGMKDEHLMKTQIPGDNSSFPSKRLPRHLEALYNANNPSVRRLEAASQQTEHQLVKPLALSAADEATSHLNAVKVRTFSSRMDVERTKRKPAANQLAKVFGESFFAPLVARYQQELAAYGAAGSVFASTPVVLVTFVKTLALLLHAAGPATLSLPDATAVFWDLLLSLRTQAIADISVLEAVLFALLTLLEINGANQQRLAQETPRQLMETQQWVELVFERTGGGQLVTAGSDEEAKVRTLAAGVLVKTREVVDAYQKLLIGNVPGL